MKRIDEMQETTVERIKRVLNCPTNRALAKRLEVHESQIGRWNRGGFYTSTDFLINLLLDLIEAKNENNP